MIIIDGHNLIGKFPGLSFDNPSVKQDLVNILKQYQAIMDRKIILAFDGTDQAGFSRHLNGAIDIRFSETGDADKLLIDLCQEFAHARDTVIISSDNEVRAAAKKSGLTTQKAEDFAKDIQNTLENYSSELDKENYLSPVNVDDWLKYFNKNK